MRTLVLISTAVALAAPLAPAIAKDYEAGKKKVQEVCVACHGEDGNKGMTPDTPRLGGQYYDYLVHALQQYKKGKRQNPLMTPMAQPLSDQEISDLAWYFSKQKGLSSKY
jgi:cytochrome c553